MQTIIAAESIFLQWKYFKKIHLKISMKSYKFKPMTSCVFNNLLWNVFIWLTKLIMQTLISAKNINFQ